MKPSFASFCLISLLSLSGVAVAQNNAYSAYYSYTVSYNGDGSANVTPTAEVSGIDDVSDWVEGSYRPLCTVRPKIQLNGDATWVGGTRVALGRAVDQVHTGQIVHVPADGSTVGLDFAVEADVFCSGAPSPTYWQYPSLVNLGSWSYIELYYWSLEGFAPPQYNPPYHSQYCPSAVTCPVSYGVASINNFVNFADFADIKIRLAVATYSLTNIGADGWNTYSLSCPNGNQMATCGTSHLSSRQLYNWAEEYALYATPGGCWRGFFEVFLNGPPAPFNCR
jgi:hypothetical protein